VDEALRAKARQQALSDALFEMQVNGVLSEVSRIFENDRPDRRFAAPIGEGLVLLAGHSKAVESCGPARVSLHATVERWEVPDWSTRVISCLGKWLGAEKFKRRRQRRSEGCRLESRPYARGLEKASTALDLHLQVFLAFASVLELFCRDAFFLCVEIRSLNFTGQSLRVAVPNSLAQTSLDVVVDDLREAAKLLFNGLGLSDQDLEHAVFDPLGEDKIMTANFRGRLQLAIDAAIALLDPPRIPWQIEVK